MKILLASVALLVPLALASCGGDDVTARDPGGAGSSAAPMPTEAPVPPGKVRTLNLATVMDTGRPELCLGPVAESYPPQCGGPEIVNWDWREHGQRVFEQQGETRWGTYLVTGTWDGTAFTVTNTVPGPLYDPMPSEPSPTPTPARAYSQAELERIAEDLRDLPGFLGSYGADGHVTVEVFYDDGSLQDWADQTYGGGVVLVISLLVDAS